MNKYVRVINVLEGLKYKFPKDEIDRVFNIAIDAAVQRVLLLEEAEKLTAEVENA